jgi:hypothetical protein
MLSRHKVMQIGTGYFEYVVNHTAWSYTCMYTVSGEFLSVY